MLRERRLVLAMGVIPFVGEVAARSVRDGWRAREGQCHLSDYWEAGTKRRVGGGALFS
jgi:hypothetical protein